MATISSRPLAAPITHSDVIDLLSKSGIRIDVTEDYLVDPPEMRIVLLGEWPRPDETLLIKPAGAAISMYDLIVVMGRLGYPVDYQELK